MANELRAWVEAVVDARYEGVAGRLAAAIDLSESAFSRGLTKGTLGIDSLLRLAAVTGESASLVLRRAGKPDIAHWIEAVYGPPKPTLPAPIQTVVDFLQNEDERYAPLRQATLDTGRWWAEQSQTPPPIAEPTFSSRPGAKSKRTRHGTRRK